MKKSIIFCLSVLFVGVAWADNCVSTTDMLKSGTSATYDEYLYVDSSESELRQEGRSGKAYLCDNSHCNVGTKIRLAGAVVGSGSVLDDAVYECANQPNGNRTSYKWVVHNIAPTCMVDLMMNSRPVPETDVKNAGTLYEYKGDYCKEIRMATQTKNYVDNRTNGWDTANTFLTQKGETVRNTMNVIGSTVTNWFDNVTEVTVTTINGGIEIIKQNNERIKIMTNGAVEMWDSSNQRRIANWRTTKDGIVEIYGQTKEGFLGGLQILSDGRVQIINSRHEKRVEIAKTRNESYLATIKFFGDVMNGVGGVVCDFNNTVRTTIIEGGKVVGITIQEFGATVRTGIEETAETVRNAFNNATNVTINAINGGVEIVANNTERIRILKEGLVEIQSNKQIAKTARWKTTVDGFIEVHESNNQKTIAKLKIREDARVEIRNSRNQTIQTIAQENGKSYRATIELFGSVISQFNKTVQTYIQSAAYVAKTAIQETGATARTGIEETSAVIQNFFDNSTDFAIDFADNTKELIITNKKENTKRIRLLGKGFVEINGQLLDAGTARWEAVTDSTAKIVIKVADTVLGGFKLLGKGGIQVFKEAKEIVTTTISETNASYRATLEFFGTNITEFGETVRELIKSKANVFGITIQEFGATVRTTMNNANDFAKHFTSEIIGGIQSLQINKARLKKLEEDIKKCQTQEQVAELIAAALREAELNDTQIAQVNQMIKEYGEKQNQHFDVIEQKIRSLEQEIKEIQQQNIVFANQIAGLGLKYTNMQSQYNNLAAQVRTKVNAKQVVELIYENTQAFTDGQKQELYVILDEYTRKLSDGQRAEVQGMIENYVNPLVRGLNTKINLESDRRVAESRVASAMSVLNAFAASADVSVWKNAEGKFNGARLASDSVAGVVLGTAGGLISNSLIKKSQTKKGFEDIRCTVGGQFVADYDDDFAVGIK